MHTTCDLNGLILKSRNGFKIFFIPVPSENEPTDGCHCIPDSS